MRYISILLCVLSPGCVVFTSPADPAAIIAIEAALANPSIDDTISREHSLERGKAKRLTPGVPSISLDHPAEPVPDETSSSPYILREGRRGFFSKDHKHKSKPVPHNTFPPPLR